MSLHHLLPVALVGIYPECFIHALLDMLISPRVNSRTVPVQHVLSIFPRDVKVLSHDIYNLHTLVAMCP